jgi:ribosome-binding protein aMBF1 (putative translation factor)
MTNEEIMRVRDEKDLEELTCDVCGREANSVVTASDGERIPLCDECRNDLVSDIHRGLVETKVSVE